MRNTYTDRHFLRSTPASQKHIPFAEETQDSTAEEVMVYILVVVFIMLFGLSLLY